jgi:hypothetical protein
MAWSRGAWVLRQADHLPIVQLQRPVLDSTIFKMLRAVWSKMPKTSKAHAMFFFLRAAEFFSAAEKLFASENRAKAPNKWEYPIYFCYSHAVELALKTFLRSHKPEVEFGHELTNTYKKCVALGLVIGPDDRTHIGNIVRCWTTETRSRVSDISWGLALFPTWRGREKLWDD